MLSNKLSSEELLELEDKIVREIPGRITEILTRTNRSGELEELLRLLGLSSLLINESGYKPYTNGKIVVVGATKVKKTDLEGVGKQLGISKGRFEFYLDYDAAKKHNFRNMLFKPIFCAILLGPMPHSGHGKGDSGSVVAALESVVELENVEGFPRVERLEGGQGLKITKSNFREKLQQLIDEGVIEPDLSA